VKRRICIVSLRYNPAHVQHLIAYAKLVQELGDESCFLLDPAYSKFPELAELAQVFDLDSNLSSLGFTHALIYNASTANRMIAAALKQNGTKILYVLHEPRHPILSFLWAEGPEIGIKGVIAHRYSVPVIKIADVVLLASRFGLKVYNDSDRKHNASCAYFPLIYDDEAYQDVDALLQGKQYFGFMGGLCRAHGFDQFLHFMRSELQRGSDLRFLIASRHPLPAEVINDPIVKKNSEKLKLQCGRPLSSEEMNLAYAESFCIWNIYRRSTQSGVLPKAFMFGTPVMASSSGSFPEFVKDGVNGRFAAGHDHRAIAQSLANIRADQRNFVVNCRRTFNEEFFYRANLSRFDRLLSSAADGRVRQQLINK
jgi:glycosyltransferase involved in cell wall biosynthesis